MTNRPELDGHEQWYAVGKTAVMVAHLGGGSYMGEAVKVERLTRTMIFTTGGRFWRYRAKASPLQRVGNDALRDIPGATRWRLVSLGHGIVRDLVAKGEITLPQPAKEN